MIAIIPAAGMGTRFLPATKAQPKEMLSIIDTPVIQYVVEEGLASGADEVVIVNSPQKKAIEAHFAFDEDLETSLRAKGKDVLADKVAHAAKLNVSFDYQYDPQGLGHAILCASHRVQDEPFFVLLGDVIVPDNTMLPRMLEISREHNGASVIAVMPVPEDQVHRFGIIDGQAIGDNVWKVTRLVEKPQPDQAPSRLSVFGRYLLSPRVMELLSDVQPGVGGEIQLTDALDLLLQEEEMYALCISEDEGYDTGTPETWLAANNAMFARRMALC